MAQVISDDDAGWHDAKTVGRHPWDEWLDGKIRLLSHGSDFTARAPSLRNLAQAAARARGLKCRTRIIGQDLQIQAYKQAAVGDQHAPDAP